MNLRFYKILGIIINVFVKKNNQKLKKIICSPKEKKKKRQKKRIKREAKTLRLMFFFHTFFIDLFYALQTFIHFEKCY